MKRATDVAVAVIALIVFAPVMLVCAALIKLQDGGPVVFLPAADRQPRPHVHAA